MLVRVVLNGFKTGLHINHSETDRQHLLSSAHTFFGPNLLLTEARRSCIFFRFDVTRAAAHPATEKISVSRRSLATPVTPIRKTGTK